MAYNGTNHVNGDNRWQMSGEITLMPEDIKAILSAGLHPNKASKPIEIITEDIEYEDVTNKRLSDGQD